MKRSSHSRREFTKIAGAALAGLAGAEPLGAQAGQTAPQNAPMGGRDPDALVVNAKVYTMDTRSPRAEAFAVTNGRFTAVGSTTDMKGLAGKNTQVFDQPGIGPARQSNRRRAGTLHDLRLLQPRQVRVLRRRDDEELHGVPLDAGCRRVRGRRLREAIAVNTYNGAWSSGEEAIKGSIMVGKLADCVVLADDPHTVAPHRIKDIQIVRTVVGGKTSYTT
jgi:Amidohydrolase family